MNKEQEEKKLQFSIIEVKYFLKVQRREVIEMIKEFEYTLYPYQVKRSKEWLAGYDYCKKGITESTKSIIKRLK